MLETPHVLLGAAIATKVANPYLAVPLALLSHFILDKIPHWNPHISSETKKFGKPTKKSTTIIAVDATIALVGGSLIAYNALPNTTLAITILACCFVAALPDIIEIPYFYFKKRDGYLMSWIPSQKSWQTDTTPFWGLLTQVITIGASLWWIFN